MTEANPSHLLDFQRFSSDQVADFNRRQVEIIRRHSPGRAILHNFMGAFTAFDHYAVGRDLDAAAWDSYPLGFLERSPRDDAFKTRHMRVGDPVSGVPSRSLSRLRAGPLVGDGATARGRELGAVESGAGAGRGAALDI